MKAGPIKLCIKVGETSVYLQIDLLAEDQKVFKFIRSEVVVAETITAEKNYLVSNSRAFRSLLTCALINLPSTCSACKFLKHTTNLTTTRDLAASGQRVPRL